MAEILRQMQVFERVVSQQSFSKAAKDLQVTRSMVSQHIKQLEESLGVQLLTRTTRQLALTPGGQEFYASCKRIVEEAEQAQQRLKDTDPEPSGKIRITAPVDLSLSRLPEVLREFIEAHPRIELELSFRDEITNLVAEQFDVGIRVGWLKDSIMRVAKLRPMQPLICASPDYLRQYGTPHTIEDLKRHRWVALSVLESPTRWRLRNQTNGKHVTLKFDPAVFADSPMGLYGCVKAGMGLGFCPSYQVEADLERGSLRQVMTSHVAREGGVYAVYPFTGIQPLRVQKLIEYLRKFSRKPRRRRPAY